ncbi:MAG: NADPH-dependent F420 reductase [Dehalococcoidia bacterium]|nr:NADPH-dependent F420 reductase [Dehalococcoidia bacterium]
MLAFLGGTGPEGKGLALRFAMAGEEVVIGSRDAGRAREAAESLLELAPGSAISGDVNEAAAAASIIFVTVPYEGQRTLLENLAPMLAGKLVVTAVAPMSFVRGRGAVALEVDDGSAAQEAQNILSESQVVASFQNISAVKLMDPAVEMEGDVVVCSDHGEAREQVIGLVSKIPKLRGVDGGALSNARYVEQLTTLLVNINRIHKTQSMIKIVGV